MPLLLHAISTKSEPEAGPTRGLRGGRLARVDVDDLTAWATEVADSTLGREDLLADHEVVTAIFEATDSILPVRFPTRFADADDLAGHVRARYAEFATRLADLKGCCELAITAVWSPSSDVEGELAEEAADATTPGRRYLLERQRAISGSEQRHARALALADTLERLVGADLVRATRRLTPSSTVVLSMAMLVKCSTVQQLTQRLPRTEVGVRILVHGPWPPYSFAAGSADT